ncbi:MAG: hypothetical protein ACOC8Y_03875 [Candidatus Natronoplasma sp.]
MISSAYSFGDVIRWRTIQRIVGYWTIVPILAVISAYIISWLLQNYLSKEKSKRPVQYLTLLMEVFVAFTAGANSVGKAVGPLMG